MICSKSWCFHPAEIPHKYWLWVFCSLCWNKLNSFGLNAPVRAFLFTLSYKLSWRLRPELQRLLLTLMDHCYIRVSVLVCSPWKHTWACGPLLMQVVKWFERLASESLGVTEGADVTCCQKHGARSFFAECSLSSASALYFKHLVFFVRL